MKQIHIGIIGCGSIAMNRHLPTLYEHPETVIKAFYNRTRSKAKTACEKFGAPDAAVYDSVDALLARKDLDAVYVLTANDTHAPFTMKALKQGLHVFVEKPTAINAAEAASMHRLAAEKEKVLLTAFQNRYRASSLWVKDTLAAGDFGEPYYIKAHAIRRRGVPSWGSFLDKKVQGGGPLVDIGSHALDLALFVIDDYDIDYVVGSTYQKLLDKPTKGNVFGLWDPKGADIEDSAFGWIKTKSGKTIVLESSYAINLEASKEAAVSIAATEGGLILDDNVRINGATPEALYEKDVTLKSIDEGYKVTDEFIKMIKNKRHIRIHPHADTTIMRIIDALYLSSKNNKPVFFE